MVSLFDVGNVLCLIPSGKYITHHITTHACVHISSQLYGWNLWRNFLKKYIHNLFPYVLWKL